MSIKLLSATTMIGDDVKNSSGEDLGTIKEFMIDKETGRVVYAVVSFGGILGVGNKLFAVPWSALRVDTENEQFILDVEKKALENAPGFDKNDWPNMASHDWGAEIHEFYAQRPFWEEPQ